MDRFDIKFGADVYGRDKQCGHLTKVVVDPATWQVTDLMIESGLLFKHVRVVPIYKVRGTSAQAVYLTINHRELNDYPEYQQTVVDKGIATWQEQPAIHEAEVHLPHQLLPYTPKVPAVQEKVRIGVADDLLLLDANTSVDGSDGNIGRLSHLIVNVPGFKISELVVSQGKLLPRQFVVPIDRVETISEQSIPITATITDVENFSEYVAPQGGTSKPDSTSDVSERSAPPL